MVTKNNDVPYRAPFAISICDKLRLVARLAYATVRK